MFVIARTAHRRPTLQHRMSEEDPDHTACGIDVRWWSRAYQPVAIPQIICMKCDRLGLRKP